MTNSIPKGGRGNLAPYEQAMCRVPEPIKDGVQKVVNEYRSAAMAQDREKGDRIAAALEAFSIEEKPVDENDGELKRLRDLIDRWAEKSLTASATSRDWVQFRRFFDEYLVMSLEVDDGNLKEVTGDVAAGDAG